MNEGAGVKSALRVSTATNPLAGAVVTVSPLTLTRPSQKGC